MVRPIKELMQEPKPCSYLAGRTAVLAQSHAIVNQGELTELVADGWNCNTAVLYRPRCGACKACLPIRVKAGEFRPNKSQRRVERKNVDTRLVVGRPRLDEARIALYLRHHDFHPDQLKIWERKNRSDAESHIQMMMNGRIAATEWAFYRFEKLVAIAYTFDVNNGFCGMYSYHDPDLRHLSLGTWIVMSIIKRAAERKLAYVYLGTYVKGNRSLEYKATFRPNQILRDGTWQEHCK